MRAFLSQTLCNRRGFTLVEMLFAIVIGLIIMAAVTGVFLSHSRTFTVHDDISIMQQNLRGALTSMPAEFRLAGCDPLESKDSEIRTASSITFEFTADLGGESNKLPNEADRQFDGPGERVAYKFCADTYTPPNTPNKLSSGDCINDRRSPGRGVLWRSAQKNGGEMGEYQMVADNIERLEFHYIIRNKGKFQSPQNMGYTENEMYQKGLKSSERSRISAVQISILVRGELEDPKYYEAPNKEFVAGSGKVWKLGDIYSGDELERARHHRRRLLITTVQLRNMVN